MAWSPRQSNSGLSAPRGVNRSPRTIVPDRWTISAKLYRMSGIEKKNHRPSNGESTALAMHFMDEHMVGSTFGPTVLPSLPFASAAVWAHSPPPKTITPINEIFPHDEFRSIGKGEGMALHLHTSGNSSNIDSAACGSARPSSARSFDDGKRRGAGLRIGGLCGETPPE